MSASKARNSSAERSKRHSSDTWPCDTCLSHDFRRTVLAVMLALLSSGARAGSTQVVETPAVQGQFVLTGARAVLTWAIVVDEDVGLVAKKLADWSKAADLVSDEASLVVTKASAEGAHLHLVLDAPIFVPDPWFDLQATIRTEGGVTRIRWARIAGTASEYQHTWTLRPIPGGTRIDHEMILLLPFDLPEAFVASRLKAQVVEDAACVARVIGRPVRRP